jgi:hypothetical protein
VDGFQISVSSTAIGSCANTSNSFTIAGPTITVTSPSSGSIWNTGAKYPITWSYTGNPGPFRIELLNYVTNFSPVIASSVQGSKGTGSYSWTIPKTLAPGFYYYLKVSSTWDKAIYGFSATFSITAATASAGPDQKVSGSAWVRLSGSNSILSGKGIASYLWTQRDGPPVAIADPSAVETGFVAPDAGLEGKSLGFQLTVTGREGAASRDNCIVNAVGDNAPPVADAGPNQAVAVSQIVELDGSRSSTGDTGPLSYSWRQVSGVPVILSDAAAAQCTFVAPEAEAAGESLVFELSVTDEAGLRSRDTCIVNVVSGNRPPTAQAGPDRTVSPGDTVTLDGTASTDEDGGIASFVWRQIAGPPVTLSDSTAAKPTFPAPDINAPTEDLVFELTVTDSGGLRDKAKVVITVVGGAALQ